MKIGYFAHFFPPAGFAASLNTYRIVRQLAAKGHEVHVFAQPMFTKYTAATSEYGVTYPENVIVHFSIPTPIPLTVTIPHLLNALVAMGEKCDFDAVVTQFHPFHLASLPGRLLKLLSGVPWIVKVHDIVLDKTMPMPFFEKSFVNLWYRTFFASVGRKANKLFVLTSELRRFLLANGFRRGQVAVVPNGVDTSLFSPDPCESRDDSRKTILYTGSMTADDGLSHLIRAFGHVASSHDSMLVLIGDGPERLSLVELSRKLNLEDRVVFNRYVSHERIPDFIRRSYVTVGPLAQTPIINYTIPTKILEYFACGKTTVSCKVSRDVLIPWETGLVVEKPEPESISECICTLLDDEKLNTKMGNTARLLVEEKYDWHRIVDTFEQEMQRS